MIKFLTAGNVYNRYIIKRKKIQKKDIQQLRLIKKQLKQFLNIKQTRKKKKKRSRSKTRKNK